MSIEFQPTVFYSLSLVCSIELVASHILKTFNETANREQEKSIQIYQMANWVYKGC